MSLSQMTPARMRRQWAGRAQRLTTGRAVRQALVSLVGVTGTPVLNQAGQEVGRLVDVVARVYEPGYPPITGVIMRVGRRRAFVDADAIAAVTASGVRLRAARVDLREFTRRPGEMLLGADVLDRQLVDVDGVQVIRAADLYLAAVADAVRVVGVDVSLQALLRRLGPRRFRATPTPARVIDWAAIAPFGDTNTDTPAQVRLRDSREALRRLRPADLADLLEDLGRTERHHLLGVLDAGVAADALEEMQPGEVRALLHDETPQDAARLVAAMEPDEAADALRRLDPAVREQLLRQMPAGEASTLRRLTSYPARTAGGVMTTRLITATAGTSAAGARTLLASNVEHRNEIDAIVVVDAAGQLVADIPLFDLLVADRDADLAETVATPEYQHPSVTVSIDTPLAQVAARLIESRRSSLLVLDEHRRPVGRILADDIIDALVPEPGRSNPDRHPQ